MPLCCRIRHKIPVPQAISRAVLDGRVKVGSGTLYNLLEQFLDADMIKETKAEGRRRCYILTDKGRELLDHEYKRLNRLVSDYQRLMGKEDTQ